MNFEAAANQNFEQAIQSNPYPGRGLVIGKSSGGKSWLQVYWIMGRSANSRNRKFSVEGSTLRTEPVDLGKVEDPSLIIYEAMLERGRRFLASNGDQTRTLYEGLGDGKGLVESLASREREPDSPNYTPRITGLLDLGAASPKVGLSLLKANKIDPQHTDRHHFFLPSPSDGIGYALTTYRGDGNPLPSFEGDPILLPLSDSAEATVDLYWDALDEANRISLAVKEIELDGSSSRIALRNKH